MSDQVQQFLDRASESGLDLEVRTMSQSTHTAAEAAAAIGCSVSEIVKSLLFIADAKPLLVLVSGPNRVDPHKLGERIGATIAMADAKSVKTITGYSIGGVPPFGHPTALRTLIDEDLLSVQGHEVEEVWAAAGTATAVFGIDPKHLVSVTNAEVVSVH